MTSAHGKDTYISVDGEDLSQYCKNSSMERNPDIHDITGYGKSSKVKRGGLKDASATISGWYDTAATGPAAVLRPLVGQTVELIRRPAGTGTGKPQETVDVVVGKYVETNPVDDIVTWTCDLACSDDIADTTQV